MELRRVLAVFSRGQLDRPSPITASLSHFSIEALLFMMARTTREETRMAISEYITTLRHVKPLLTGKDLIAMGYKPGPLFGKILAALREARLDGKVVSRQDEVKLVRTKFLPERHERVRLTR